MSPEIVAYLGLSTHAEGPLSARSCRSLLIGAELLDHPSDSNPSNGRPMAYTQRGGRSMPNAAARSSSGRTRAERLEVRVTAEQKRLIERAAALQGRTVTDFALASVQDAARRAIQEYHQLTVSVRDSEAFVNAL